MRFGWKLVGELNDTTLEEFFQSLVAAVNGHGVTRSSV